MRSRTNFIILWGGLLVALWAATFLSVRWLIGVHARSTDDARAHRTLLSLRSAESQRMQRMRQGARLMMTVPELRALTGEARGGVSEENLGALTGRLDALRTLVDASCVCVLDASADAVAQNSRSPWASLDELRSFLAGSPQASAMVASVFAAAESSTPDQPPPEVWGVWSSGSELYHVVAMPLVSVAGDAGPPARVDGALITAARVGDDFVRALSRGSGCEVTFIAAGNVAASSLSADLRPAIARIGDANAATAINGPSEAGLGETAYRSLVRPVVDPCSGGVVGAVVIQGDLASPRALQRNIAAAFVLLLAGGVVTAAVAARLSRVNVVRATNPLAGASSTGAPASLNFATASAAPSFRLEMRMSLPPTPMPLDYDALVQRCCGNAAVAERVIEKFAVQLTEVMTTLQRNVDAADAAELAKAAHALKGTAAMTGAEGVRGFAESLEKLGRDGRLDGAEGLLGSLRAQVDACLLFISQRRSSAGAPPAATSSATGIAA